MAPVARPKTATRSRTEKSAPRAHVSENHSRPSRHPLPLNDGPREQHKPSGSEPHRRIKQRWNLMHSDSNRKKRRAPDEINDAERQQRLPGSRMRLDSVRFPWSCQSATSERRDFSKPRRGLSLSKRSYSAYRQKLFVKTTNLARAIHKMNFQNPVALFSIFTDAAHPNRIVRMNVQRNFVPRNSLVRKMPDQMARDRAAELPAIFRGKFVRMTIQLVRFDVGMRS